MADRVRQPIDGCPVSVIASFCVKRWVLKRRWSVPDAGIRDSTRWKMEETKPI